VHQKKMRGLFTLLSLGVNPKRIAKRIILVCRISKSPQILMTHPVEPGLIRKYGNNWNTTKKQDPASQYQAG